MNRQLRNNINEKDVVANSLTFLSMSPGLCG